MILRIKIILVWNCGGLSIIITELWIQKLTKPGGAFWHWNCPNVFCALMNVCDGVPYVWFYLGTTESMAAERNIFSARSRFGFQGNITKEMWSHVHMKRSRRRSPLMQHLRNITKMKNKIGKCCQNKQTAAFIFLKNIALNRFRGVRRRK